MMMSGSCRSNARTPSAKLRSILWWTCIWLKLGSTISIGSSIVQTLTSGVARCFKLVYRVVVLPDPVGPVTSTIPFGLSHICSHRPKSSLAKPSCPNDLSNMSGSKIRITIFSPCAVGKVERRSSTSCWSTVFVFNRPS